jgi:DNA-directed RNA polymerase specialized sigma24 family protein
VSDVIGLMGVRPGRVGVAMDAEQDADFTAFVASQWAGLFRAAYRLTGDYQRAEGLLQTAMAKMYVAWPRISRMRAA